MDGTNIVASLRAEMGVTLAELGGLVGISKSQMHEVERTDRAALRVALAIEALANGRYGPGKIDAALLSDDVRIARHSLDPSAAADAPSPDIAAESIGAEVPEPDAVNASAPSGRTLLRPAQDGPDEASASAVPVPAMVPQVPAGAGAADDTIPALRQAQGERKQVA